MFIMRRILRCTGLRQHHPAPASSPFTTPLRCVHNSSAIAPHTAAHLEDKKIKMNNNRFLVGIVIVLAVLLGVVGVSGISYREGFSDGARSAPQYVYPRDDAPRAVPAPAPAPAPVPAPGYYAQPYYGNGRPGGWGGFNPLGFFFNILLIGGVIFIVSRLVFRRRFGGRGPWGRGGGWGGPGAWGKWGDWHRDRGHDESGKGDQPREQPRKRDDEVI
jgi:hypothetical protein